MAVAGAGAFGRNHLRVLRELEIEGAGVALVAAVDPDAARADEAAKQYGIPVFASVDALLKADLKLDAACVAVPTVKHYEVAWELLARGSICSSRSRWRRLSLKPTICPNPGKEMRASCSRDIWSASTRR